jgi:tRNA (guanine37-N1)-methyltransferase
MNIIVFTLFPNIFNDFLKTSIIKNALAKKTIDIKIINFRTFATGKRQQTDDYQYGGGGGMVLSLPPIVTAIKKYAKKNTKVILLSPQGKTFNQSQAQLLSKKYQDIILIAGHYEGFDERILNYVDEVISIGDYILTGGEIPAMVVIEACARLVDKTISKKSLECETFDNDLLDYPVYTKPLVFEKHTVPAVLLSGDHKKINA